jgi:hypothetical protein
VSELGVGKKKKKLIFGVAVSKLGVGKKIKYLGVPWHLHPPTWFRHCKRGRRFELDMFTS